MGSKKWFCGEGKKSSENHEWADWYEDVKEGYLVSGCRKCPATRVVSKDCITIENAHSFYREK